MASPSSAGMKGLTAAALLPLLAAACISYVGAPTAAPTAAPTPPPAAAPTNTLPLEPTPTPDPNASPTLDVRTLLNSSLTLFNLASDVITVTITIEHGEADGSDASLGSFQLDPEHSTTRNVLGGQEDVLPYLIEFSYPSGSASLGGTCSLGVVNGDEYTFVAVDEGLTITRGAEVPATIDETIIETSSLCDVPPLPTPEPT